MTTEKELARIKQLLDSAEKSIFEAKSLLFQSELTRKAKDLALEGDGEIIEGIFDGEKMMDQSNHQYQIPANYASKSKLVVGDVLKLTILSDGTFLYKQIGPVARKKVVGLLKEAGAGKFLVSTPDGDFHVLPASITYFKASVGDKLTVLIPEETTSEWAAVENIIKN